MENKQFEKQARKYLYDNTTYPGWWIDELPSKKLLAIYFNKKRKQKHEKRGDIK